VHITDWRQVRSPVGTAAKGQIQKRATNVASSIRKFARKNRKKKETVQPKLEIQRNPPNMVEGQPQIERKLQKKKKAYKNDSIEKQKKFDRTN
jgi:hypothetical protein